MTICCNLVLSWKDDRSPGFNLQEIFPETSLLIQIISDVSGYQLWGGTKFKFTLETFYMEQVVNDNKEVVNLGWMAICIVHRFEVHLKLYCCTLNDAIVCTVTSNRVRTFVYGTRAIVALMYQLLQFRLVWSEEAGLYLGRKYINSIYFKWSKKVKLR